MAEYADSLWGKVMYEIIVNPGSQSGKGLRNWEKAKSAFEKRNAEYRVHFTERNEDESAAALALYNEYMEKKEVLHLIVLGGDGTVNDILQVLPDFENVSLSVIPSGSGNDLCRSLGIFGDIEEIAAHIIDNPITEKVDVGLVHSENSTLANRDISERRFLVSTGIGYDAAITEEVSVSDLKSLFNKLGAGRVVYLAVALKQLVSMRYGTARLTINDGKKTETIPLNRFLFVAGMNHKYEGGGFMFGGADSSNSDGMIDICAVHGLSKAKVLQVIPQAKTGKHFKNKGVDHYRVSSYTVKTSTPMWIHTDGEVKLRADYVSVSVMKKALTLIY